MAEYERLELTVYVERQDSMDSAENARFANHLVVEALEDPGPMVKFITVNNQISVEMDNKKFAQMLAESTHVNASSDPLERAVDDSIEQIADAAEELRPEEDENG